MYITKLNGDIRDIFEVPSVRKALALKQIVQVDQWRVKPNYDMAVLIHNHTFPV